MVRRDPTTRALIVAANGQHVSRRAVSDHRRECVKVVHRLEWQGNASRGVARGWPAVGVVRREHSLSSSSSSWAWRMLCWQSIAAVPVAAMEGPIAQQVVWVT